MPVFQKAHKLIALSAFALTATLFHATAMRAATTADAAATISTSADTATAQPQDAPATPPAAAPAPAAPAAAPVWSVGPIDFSGLVDGYYDFNANHPSTGQNALRNFDFDANSFSLNMVKLSMSHTADPIGFQVDLGFGKAFSPQGVGVSSNLNGSSQSDATNDIHLEQAYVSWKPAKGKGFEADFGQFVTSAGAEVIETMNNPNYTRSLLFVETIPYYHMGLRTSMPITKKETIGFQVVNGWNNITDTNAGKTIGLTSLYTAAKYNWALNYYVGPENLVSGQGTDVGYRNLIDTTLNLTTTAKWTSYINYDYVQNRNAALNSSGFGYHTTNLYRKQGIALESRFQATGTIALSGRYEYLVDGNEAGDTGGSSCLITSSSCAGGFNKATLQEFTITGEYKVAEGMLARLEYRRDNVDNNYFQKGTSKFVHGQSTLELGVVAFFGPKR